MGIATPPAEYNEEELQPAAVKRSRDNNNNNNNSDTSGRCRIRDIIKIYSEFNQCKLIDTETNPKKWFLHLDILNDQLDTIGPESVSYTHLRAHET